MKTIEKIKKSEFVKKDGTLKVAVESAIRNSRKTSNKLYPKRWTGSGRHMNLIDYSIYITGILNECGYKYTTGNDASREGKEGDYIKISKVAMNSLLQLI